MPTVRNLITQPVGSRDRKQDRTQYVSMTGLVLGQNKQELLELISKFTHNYCIPRYCNPEKRRKETESPREGK